MRITFNPYSQVQFRGINDAIRKIKTQIESGGFKPMQDQFTPAPENKTIVIENYYENGNNHKANAVAEGAIGGATSGTAVVGAKGIGEKLKGAKSTVSGDKSVNLLDDKGIDTETDSTDAIDLDNDTDVDTDIDSDTDIEPDIDVEPDIDPDIDVDPDIDIDPEIDIDITD